MTHGPDAIAELIEETGWSYPISIERLEREHALANIEIDDQGNSIMLAELFGRGDLDRFQSEADMREQLRPVFEELERERRSGVIDKLKRTFLGR